MVKHSISEYVDGQVHVNRVESFWAVLKRECHGVYHYVSKKHLRRYLAQFAGKHILRDLDTEIQTQHVVAGVMGSEVLNREFLARTKMGTGHVD